MLYLLAYGCFLTNAIHFAVKECLVDGSMLKVVFAIAMQTPHILIVLLTEDHAYN